MYAGLLLLLKMMIPFMAIIITCTFICSFFLLMWSFYACFCLKWEGGLNRTSLVELQAHWQALLLVCVNTCMELSRVLLAIGCSCKSLGKYFFDKWLLTPVFFYIYIYIYNIFMVTSYPFKGKTPMVWRICHRLMLKVDCCGWL